MEGRGTGTTTTRPAPLRRKIMTCREEDEEEEIIRGITTITHIVHLKRGMGCWQMVHSQSKGVEGEVEEIVMERGRTDALVRAELRQLWVEMTLRGTRMETEVTGKAADFVVHIKCFIFKNNDLIFQLNQHTILIHFI